MLVLLRVSALPSIASAEGGRLLRVLQLRFDQMSTGSTAGRLLLDLINPRTELRLIVRL